MGAKACNIMNIKFGIVCNLCIYFCELGRGWRGEGWGQGVSVELVKEDKSSPK